MAEKNLKLAFASNNIPITGGTFSPGVVLQIRFSNKPVILKEINIEYAISRGATSGASVNYTESIFNIHLPFAANNDVMDVQNPWLLGSAGAESVLQNNVMSHSYKYFDTLNPRWILKTRLDGGFQVQFSFMYKWLSNPAENQDIFWGISCIYDLLDV